MFRSAVAIAHSAKKWRRASELFCYRGFGTALRSSSLCAVRLLKCSVAALGAFALRVVCLSRAYAAERDLGRVSQYCNFFCQPAGFAELRAAGKSPEALTQASSRFKIIQHGEARLLAIGG